MRNIIIIGPPASGKLTIAKVLAKEKGYFLFDNHRSIDAVSIINANQDVKPAGLCDPIRKCVLQAAVSSNTPTIFTMVYGYPIDDEIMREYTDILTSDDLPVIVQLHCTREDSRKRSQDESRSGTTKIRSADKIDRLYAQYDVESDYVSSALDVLHLNTSELSVHESVKAIVERIRQGTVEKT